jgi:hypothetical protein
VENINYDLLYFFLGIFINSLSKLVESSPEKNMKALLDEAVASSYISADITRHSVDISPAGEVKDRLRKFLLK